MYHERAAWRCAFFVGKKMEAKDINKEMLPMYGEHCLSHLSVHNWVQKFSEGRTSIEDEHRAGRQVEIATPQKVAARRRHHRSREEGHRRRCSNRYWLFTWSGLQHGAFPAFLTMMRLKEQCARGSDSNQKNFTPQVSRDL